MLRNSSIDENPYISKKQISIAIIFENLNDFFLSKMNISPVNRRNPNFPRRSFYLQRIWYSFWIINWFISRFNPWTQSFFRKSASYGKIEENSFFRFKKLKNSLQRFEKSLKFEDHPKSSNDAFDEDEFKKVSDEIKL